MPLSWGAVHYTWYRAYWTIVASWGNVDSLPVCTSGKAYTSAYDVCDVWPRTDTYHDVETRLVSKNLLYSLRVRRTGPPSYERGLYKIALPDNTTPGYEIAT